MTYNNNFQVDYTCPGFCSKCFAEVAEFRGSTEVSPGVYRPNIVGIKANFRNQTVHLSNGTQMIVTLCENCVNLTPSDLPSLMANELKGWQKEVEQFGLKEDVINWVKSAETLSIIDVPSMKFDEATKLELSKGVSDVVDI